MFMLSSLSTKCPLYTSPEQATKWNQRGAGRSERARGDERRTCFHLHGDGVPLALVQQLERDPNVPGRAQPTGSAVRCSTAAEDGAEREHGAAEQRLKCGAAFRTRARAAPGVQRASGAPAGTGMHVAPGLGCAGAGRRGGSGRSGGSKAHGASAPPKASSLGRSGGESAGVLTRSSRRSPSPSWARALRARRGGSSPRKVHFWTQAKHLPSLAARRWLPRFRRPSALLQRAAPLRGCAPARLQAAVSRPLRPVSPQ